MFQLPAPPPVLVTRQIECVSCKQLFAVAEDTPIANHSGGDNWHLIPDHNAEITLRERPTWDHRSVMPPARAQPGENHHNPLHLANNNQNFYVNCPRCGADNRNWMRYVYEPPIETTLNSPITKPLLIMFYRFPLASVGLIITMSISSFTFVKSLLDRDGLNQILYYTLPQTLVVFLAGLIPTLLITQQWQRVRDYKNLHRYLGPRSLVERILLPQLNSLAYLGIFLIIIPLMLYFVIPWAFDTTFSIINPPLEATSPSKWVATVDKQFLKSWFWSVGLSGLIATIFAMVATEKFVGQVNTQVPPPLYYSIANMTRVVVWEAKRVLGISGSINHIQWTEASRNEIGGIDLVGIHRETPSTNYNNVSPNEKVLAQCYTISSNIWGHIVSTNVHDTKAPPMIQVPYYSIDSSLWPTRSPNPHAPVFLQPEERRETLQEPTNQPSNRRGRPTLWSTPTHTSPLRNLREDSSQPSSRIAFTPVTPHASAYQTFSSTGSLPLGEVARLRDMVDTYFNQSELEDLCMDLGISYEQLTGTMKRDKVRELILYVARRSLTSQLIAACDRLRPSASWKINL